MSNSSYGLLFSVLSPFFSSIATIFKSGAAKSLTPLIVIVIGGLIGSAILFVLSKVFHEKISRRKLKRHWKELAVMIISRSLLGELFFTIGLSQTDVIKAIFLTKVEPYFVLLIGWIFLREKVKPRYFYLLSIHLTGAVLLSTKGNFQSVGKAQVGDLFIIIAVALFAFSYRYGKKLAKDVGSISSNAISMGIASLILLPTLFIFTSPNKIYPVQGWIFLIIYVILFNVLSLTLWYASLKTVKGWIVSSLRYIGPVLGAPVAYLVFGETLNLIQIIGASLVVITSFLIAREHFRKDKE